MKEIDNLPFIEELIEKFSLDLSNLVVYTEAASGSYSLNPFLALLAGASKVYAQTRTSKYGDADEVIAHSIKLAKALNCENRLEVFEGRNHQMLAESDIVTNSNFVRPIDKNLLQSLKTSAVVPLMWETWEYRESDFDLDYCQKNNILSLGTHENTGPANMQKYTGNLGISMLFKLGVDFGRVMIIGGPDTFAGVIAEYIKRIDIDVTWVHDCEAADLNYQEFDQYIGKYGKHYSRVLVCDHNSERTIIGQNGLISTSNINYFSNNLKVGIISGNVEKSFLIDNRLEHHPDEIAPKGFMTYQPYIFGHKPILSLFAGGLKVGQEMAKARLTGFNVIESAKIALDKSPAMDFLNERAWIRE